MGPKVVIAVSAVLLAGCGGSADEQTSTVSSTSTTVSPTTTPTTTTTTVSTAPPSTSVCDDLAGPVGVLAAMVPRLASADLDAVSSQEAWELSLAQYEVDATAWREIAELVPELRDAAQRAAIHLAEVAATGRATEPDLTAIDRARTTSRTLIDPVAAGLGPRMPTREASAGAELIDFVQRTCPELFPTG